MSFIFIDDLCLGSNLLNDHRNSPKVRSGSKPVYYYIPKESMNTNLISTWYRLVGEFVGNLVFWHLRSMLGE